MKIKPVYFKIMKISDCTEYNFASNSWYDITMISLPILFYFAFYTLIIVSGLNGKNQIISWQMALVAIVFGIIFLNVFYLHLLCVNVDFYLIVTSLVVIPCVGGIIGYFTIKIIGYFLSFLNIK